MLANDVCLLKITLINFYKTFCPQFPLARLTIMYRSTTGIKVNEDEQFGLISSILVCHVDSHLVVSLNLRTDSSRNRKAWRFIYVPKITGVN